MSLESKLVEEFDAILENDTSAFDDTPVLANQRRKNLLSGIGKDFEVEEPKLRMRKTRRIKGR